MSQPVSGYLYDRNIVNLKSSTTVSSTADTAATDLTQFDSNGITLVFSVSATAGAGSLVITPKFSSTAAGTYTNSAVTVTLNAAGVFTLFVPDMLGPWIELTQTLTGTSVTYSVFAYGNPGDATTSAVYTNAPQSSPS